MLGLLLATSWHSLHVHAIASGFVLFVAATATLSHLATSWNDAGWPQRKDANTQIRAIAVCCQHIDTALHGESPALGCLVANSNGRAKLKLSRPFFPQRIYKVFAPKAWHGSVVPAQRTTSDSHKQLLRFLGSREASASTCNSEPNLQPSLSRGLSVRFACSHIGPMALLGRLASAWWGLFLPRLLVVSGQEAFSASHLGLRFWN